MIVQHEPRRANRQTTISRSSGGLTTKIHLAADSRVTAGQAGGAGDSDFDVEDRVPTRQPRPAPSYGSPEKPGLSRLRADEKNGLSAILWVEPGRIGRKTDPDVAAYGDRGPLAEAVGGCGRRGLCPSTSRPAGQYESQNNHRRRGTSRPRRRCRGGHVRPRGHECAEEHRRSRQRRVREGAGSPGPQWDLVATHIETWYHPLPWIGKEVDGVSCPDLAAVKNTKITCTAKSGSTRVTVPVSVVEVAGGTAPRVTWKFGR